MTNDNVVDEPAVYRSLFTDLASELTADGWKAALENPPDAYIHVSRPLWGDENMNGIHLEAYVLGRELHTRKAPVALHCEGGCPFQRKFMTAATDKLRPVIQHWPGGWRVGDGSGCSVCEVEIEVSASPEETIGRIRTELRRLQSLDELITNLIVESSG